MIYNGGQCKNKKYVFTDMCITESPCCTPETNTILQINYISIKIKKKKNYLFAHNFPEYPLLCLEPWLSRWYHVIPYLPS